MAEDKIIKQLKKLKAIKPNQNWAVLAKQELLNKCFEDKKPSVFEWMRFQEHGALIVSLATIIVIFGAYFGLQLVQIEQNTPIAAVDSRGLADSLKNLEASMNIITMELKDVNQAQGALAIKNTVDSVISEGEKVLADAKAKMIKKSGILVTKEPSEEAKKEVLSALSSAETALSAMKETSEQVQKEIADREIQELKLGILTDSQKKILDEAEQYFISGDYTKALENIIAISQTN